MSNVVAFDLNKLPAHIQARLGQDLSVNNALGVASGAPIARLSLDGRRFTVIKDGKETILNDPRTDEPANSIEVAIIRANPGMTKTFYAEGYVRGSQSKPACFSNDGDRPDNMASDPQAKTCALCPMNNFGSQRLADGSFGRGKACSDTKVLAVAAPDRLDQPMRLRVPAASLKNLAQYGKLLGAKQMTFPLVATRIGFDPTATWVMTFKAVGFLDDESVATIDALQTDEEVLRITGESFNSATEEQAPVARAAKPQPVVIQDAEVADEEEEEPVPLKAKPKAAVRQDAPTPAAKPKASVSQDEQLSDDVGAFLAGAFAD